MVVIQKVVWVVIADNKKVVTVTTQIWYNLTTSWLSELSLIVVMVTTLRPIGLLKQTSSQVQPLTTLKLSIGDNLVIIR